MKKITTLLLSIASLVAVSQVSMPIDFETPQTFVDFDGGYFSRVANSQKSGINTSDTVGRIIRFGGQPWGGSKIVLDAPIDFTTNKFIRMDVFTYAPVGTTVKLKLEGGTTDQEVDVLTLTSGAWETLVFDYTTIGTDQTTLVFMFDFGNTGDSCATSTFLFDNVIQSSDGTTPAAATATTNPDGNCDNIVVAETCDDGIMNQDETGIDCGGSSCSACTSTSVSEDLSSSVNVYPNPATSQVTVSSSATIDNVQISNIAGSVVSSTNGAGTIDVSGLPSGIYIVKYTSGEAVSFDKLIIE